MPAAEPRRPPATVVLVEGPSDAVALDVLARRMGLDLDARAIEIVDVGGVTNMTAAATAVRLAHPAARIAGLYDVREERHVRRALRALGIDAASVADVEAAGFAACDADLEDELIRAMGADAVIELIDAEGDGDPWRTLLRQPQHRGRPVDAVLHRFMGTKARRKARYAQLLVEALPLHRVPRPMAAVLDAAMR